MQICYGSPVHCRKNTNKHIYAVLYRDATEVLYIVQRILTNIYAVLYRDATEALYTVQRILTNIIYAVLYRDVTEALYIVQRIVQHNGSPVHCPKNTFFFFFFFTSDAVLCSQRRYRSPVECPKNSEEHMQLYVVWHNGSPVHCPENTNEHMQFYTEMPQKPCTSVAHFFYHLEWQSVLNSTSIGHSVLMMQKQQDTRLAENKIRGWEQNRKSWSSHHW